eukprot:1925431-Pleurochrysis_carterae.AAC.1
MEEAKKVHVVDVEATPCRSEAGIRHCHSRCKCVCVSVETRSLRVTGPASALAKLAHFSSGHRMNLRPYEVAFIIVNKGTAISFAARCAKALAFVALHAIRRNIIFSGKRVAS